MKTLLKLSAIILCLMIAVPQVQAQDDLLKKFGNKVKVRKDRKIDRGMDKILDKAEDAIDKAVKGEKSEDSSSDDAKSAEGAANPSEAGDEPTNAPQEDTNEVNKERNSDFDLSGIMGGGKEMEPLPDVDLSGGSRPEKGVVGKGPYGIPSGMMVVTTHTDNKMVKIKAVDTLYFDDYGNRQVRYQHSEQNINVMGIKNNEHTYTISHVIGDSLYTADPVKRTGTAMLNPASEFYNGITEEEAEKMATEMAEGMNAKVNYLGTDKYLGKVCEVYDTKMYTEDGKLMAHSRTWMRKGLVYKSESNALGVTVIQEAVVVKENVSVSSSRFKKLRGIKYTTLDYFEKN